MADNVENLATQSVTKSLHEKTRTRAKPKVKSKWDDSDTRALIQAVERHSSIWDFSCADHNNLNVRESAWRTVNDEIVSSFDSSHFGVNECKAKWNNVMTTYRDKKNKMLSTKSGQGTEYKPVWCFWSDMQFVTNNETAKNTVSESNFTFETFAESELQSIDIEVDELTMTSPTATSSPTPRSASSASDLSTIGIASGSGIGVRKRKKSAPMHDEIRNANMQRALDVLNSVADDQWTCVGTLVANELRELAKKSSAIADRAKRKVLQLLCQIGDEIDAPEPIMEWQVAQATPQPQYQVDQPFQQTEQRWNIVVDDSLPRGMMYVENSSNVLPIPTSHEPSNVGQNDKNDAEGEYEDEYEEEEDQANGAQKIAGGSVSARTRNKVKL